MNGSNSEGQLKSLVERIENREQAKQEIADEIKEIYKEAESDGYTAAALRAIVKEIRLDKAKKAKRAELAETIDTYKAALGMLSDLPLGQSALERNVLAAG
jgi:uncharacterized protein (UPF0335 family)